MYRFLALMAAGMSLVVSGAALADEAPPTTQEMVGEALSLARSAAQGDKDALATLRSHEEYMDLEFGLGEYYVLTKDYAQSITWFQKSAAQGFAGGYYGLGEAYETGRGVTRDYAQAMILYLKATELPEAGLRIGQLYGEGHGVKQDKAQAAAWYRKAADAGSVTADIALGDAYQTGTGIRQDDTQAMHWYRTAADAGDAEAQYRVGLLFEKPGSLQDYTQSAYWYGKASQQGVADAQLHLGLCYSNGRGVPADAAKAVQQFQMAANQGNGQAQYHLAESFATGRGMPADPVRAYEWMTIAKASLEAKDPTASLATESLKDLEGQLSPKQITRAKQDAAEWLQSHGATRH